MVIIGILTFIEESEGDGFAKVGVDVVGYVDLDPSFALDGA